MKIFLKKIWRYLKIVLIFFFFFSLFLVILYRFMAPPITPLMVIRLGEQTFEGKSWKLKKEWVPIEKISPNLVVAVMASEDQKFLQHSGFDWDAIKKAFESNNKKSKRKRVVRGASTISQQVAKNVFLWPGRSWLRKGLEVYFTFLIELFWSKERIIEVYLNVIEMGDGVYGAEMASRTYFKHPAKDLTKDQASGIAAVLPNPRKYSVTRPSAYVVQRKVWIKRNMNYIGKVNFD
jgi:monofunctional biosynthetic peptidoglycan transglycosylase